MSSDPLAWDIHLDRAAFERWFEERFGDARLFEHLTADVVTDEVQQSHARGEEIRLEDDGFNARCVERIEATLATLVEAEASEA